MKLSFFAPFIFALSCATVASAQIEVEKSKSGDNKKVKVFTEENEYFDDGGGSSENKNMIKLDPALIAFGEVVLFYERRITDAFSVEAGAGVTVATPLTIIFSDFLGLMDENMIDMYPESASSELGRTFKLAPRFYPLRDGDFEGPYLAPTYHYKDFRFSIPLDNGFGNPPGESMSMKWRYHDFMAQGGYQYEFSDFFYVDTYVAVGIRKRSLDYIEQRYDSNTGNYSYMPNTYKKDGIGYAVGTKIGIRF